MVGDQEIDEQAGRAAGVGHFVYANDFFGWKSRLSTSASHAGGPRRQCIDLLRRFLRLEVASEAIDD